MKKIVISILVLILLVLVNLDSLRMWICKGQLLPSLRQAVQFFAPPSDLYEFMLNEPVDLSAGSSTISYTFTNKYAGKHTIGLLLRNWAMYPPTNIPPTFSLVFTFSPQSQRMSQATVTNALYPFWGLRGDGIALLEYTTPHDLPINQPITMTVRVNRADPKLQEKHGPIAVYVQKQSEE